MVSCVSTLKTTRLLHFLQCPIGFILVFPSQVATLRPHLGQYIVFDFSTITTSFLSHNKKHPHFVSASVQRSYIYEKNENFKSHFLYFRHYNIFSEHIEQLYFFIYLSNAIRTLSSVFPPILFATCDQERPSTTLKFTILRI